MVGNGKPRFKILRIDVRILSLEKFFGGLAGRKNGESGKAGRQGENGKYDMVESPKPCLSINRGLVVSPFFPEAVKGTRDDNEMRPGETELLSPPVGRHNKPAGIKSHRGHLKIIKRIQSLAIHELLVAEGLEQ